MCVLMLRSLHRRAAAASASAAHCLAPQHCDRRAARIIIIPALLLLLLLLMPMPVSSAFLVSSTSSFMQIQQQPVIAASSSEMISSRIQAPSPITSQEGHEFISAQSQAPQGQFMRLHRRLGFNLEEAFELFKRRCQESNCRRRPGFHILHAVPSGPNPISNYLPSNFYDRFSSWAPASPPS